MPSEYFGSILEQRLSRRSFVVGTSLATAFTTLPTLSLAAQPATPGTPAPQAFSHHFLIETIIASGGRIASFQPEQVRLEDAFLKLTTGAVQ